MGIVKPDISQTLFKTAFSAALTDDDLVGAANSIVGARARIREMVFVKIMIVVILKCC